MMRVISYNTVHCTVYNRHKAPKNTQQSACIFYSIFYSIFWGKVRFKKNVLYDSVFFTQRKKMAIQRGLTFTYGNTIIKY